MTVPPSVCSQNGAGRAARAGGRATEPMDLLRTISRIAVCANDRIESAEVLRCAVRAIGEGLGWALGHAYRVLDGMVVHPTDVWWQSDDWADQDPAPLAGLVAMSEHVTFGPGVGLPGLALRDGAPVWVADLAGAIGLPRSVAAAQAGLTSAFALPAVVGDRVVAVVEFFSTEPREADPLLLDAASTIGTILGRAFERIEAENDRLAHRQQEQLILDNAGDAYVAIDDAGLVTGWNREAERLYGYPAAEAIGRPMADLIIPEEYRADHFEGIERFKRLGHGRVPGQYIELEALRSTGERFPVEMVFWGIRRDGRWNFHSFGRDITQRKAREDELIYFTLHDELTGLPNRTAAMAHITDALARCDGDGGGVALLFMDLDRFKVTRERLGHHAADQLLQMVVKRVATAVRSTDWVARLADDEFVIVCEDVTEPAAAVTIAERVLAELVEPITLAEDEVNAGASIGIVIARSVTDTAEDLLRDASAGISTARNRTRGEIKVFDDDTRGRIRRRLSTERDLTACVERGELRLHYQPIVNLADESIIGVEALLRWQHPERGLLSPADFIDIAEETGMIVPIGSWVVREAASQARRWQQAGISHLGVGINLSARQFSQSGLVEMVAGVVDDVGLDVAANPLVFEVTETMLMHEPESAARTLARLRDLGMLLSIDDFGTGYSSLAYLKSFPVDSVKIDRSFVTQVHHDPNDRAIVTAVTELGHALGLNVLAEGIETDDQRDCLAGIGCDLAQGYYFGRPVPPERIADRLAITV